MSVHYQRHGEVGVISIANPPVNALSQAVRSGLLSALEEGLADQQAQALVVMAEGRTFIAGADIREFGKPPQAPLLPDVITQLEACPKPLIASLHGTALGGGLEVALGCHYRIALTGTMTELPRRLAAVAILNSPSCSAMAFSSVPISVIPVTVENCAICAMNSAFSIGAKGSWF